MTERAGSPSDRTALAWSTLHDYEKPERYLAIGSTEGDALLARAPAALTSPSAEHPDGSARAYLAHSCDLTVSGGISTALAAPLAACALAEHYVLRRIGGAGVAALSATAVAAAEFARVSGSRDATCGYPALARATGALAGDADSAPQNRRDPDGDGSVIARFLQPSPRLSGVGRLVGAAVAPGRGPVRRGLGLAAAVAALPYGAPAVAVAVVWVGILLAWIGLTVALLRSPTVSGWVVAVITPALLVTVVLAGLAVTALAAVMALRRVVRVDAAEEYFGLVPGVPVDDPQGTRRGPGALDRLAGVRDSGDAPPLTSWFADLVDDVAGMRQGDDDRHALTFGDLWLGRTATEADDEQLRRAAADPEHRVVDLRLVAADVTRGRPVTLPGAGPAATGWLVCPDCWHAVLPARVVDQVLAASPQPVEHACPRHGTHLRPLPPAWELPVAAAARMAAGVPGLLRAVPLYRADAADAREHSDGGGGAVTSTVTTHWLTGSPPADAPVSMFDTGLPRWPTVALAVVSDDSRPDAADGPWIETPDAERAPAPPVAPRDGVAFARAVLAAPRGWRDRIARELPGTRHRFAIVRRGAGVGLVPSDDEVLRLALRGHHAGREIRERFTGRDGEIGTQTGTDRYRWIRIRSALREQRDQSLAVTARLPLLGELSRAYRVPAGVATWFTPPISPGRVDPAWVDATAALTHLRTLAEGGVLDWDTDYGSPPRDPDGPV